MKCKRQLYFQKRSYKQKMDTKKKKKIIIGSIIGVIFLVILAGFSVWGTRRLQKNKSIDASKFVQ